MNFNKYFCNTEGIYLMHGVLELNSILHSNYPPTDLYFKIIPNKIIIIYQRDESNEVWVNIGAETNMAIIPPISKASESTYEVNLK